MAHFEGDHAVDNTTRFCSEYGGLISTTTNTAYKVHRACVFSRGFFQLECTAWQL